jgi:hypothetical protein
MTAGNGSTRKRTGWRKAHGNAAKQGRTIVWETTPSDEQATAPEGATVAIERASHGKFTSAGAAEAARRRWELADLPDYAEFELALVPLDDWKPFDVIRRANYQQELDDIVDRTGGASRRVKKILRGWAYLGASAEYWAAVFQTTGDPHADERAERRYKAASIEGQKAWDAACAEADVRLKANPGKAADAARKAFSRPVAPTLPTPAQNAPAGPIGGLNGQSVGGGANGP